GEPRVQGLPGQGQGSRSRPGSPGAAPRSLSGRSQDPAGEGRKDLRTDELLARGHAVRRTEEPGPPDVRTPGTSRPEAEANRHRADPRSLPETRGMASAHAGGSPARAGGLVKVRVPGHILKIAPYVPGKPIEEAERQFGIHQPVKLASNENPLGPSP